MHGSSENGSAVLKLDETVVPHSDAHAGYIRESTSDQYVPDVFYTVSVYCIV